MFHEAVFQSASGAECTGGEKDANGCAGMDAPDRRWFGQFSIDVCPHHALLECRPYVEAASADAARSEHVLPMLDGIIRYVDTSSIASCMCSAHPHSKLAAQRVRARR